MLYLVLIIAVLLRVAFVTLLERRVLGFIQSRQGPNKVGLIGLFQPFADAVKLFRKENNFLIWYNAFIYYVCPIISLILMLIYWLVFSWVRLDMGMSYSFLFILVVSRLSVYTILGGGWSSNSKYALLGSYRGVAQTISYEVAFSFILLSVLVLGGGYKRVCLSFAQEVWSFIYGLWLLFVFWLVTILAETNRTPFDFAEGESELVSGFNVEYGASGFAFLFIAEYGSIIFIGFFTTCLFVGGFSHFAWAFFIILFFFLWARGSLVRFRYDNLIMMTWKVILPFRLFRLIFIIYTVFMIDA